jgi:thymidylate kinase
MENRVVIIDGPDGTGKTTQALYLCSYFHYEQQRGVAYVSFPVYEFPFGKIIGRCLGRWGEKEKLPLLSPEDMALLYVLNRLETLPFLNKLREEGYIRVLNRGPFSNLFSVARQVILDGVDWGSLSPAGKKARVDPILRLDQEFVEKITRDSKVLNLFLLMDPSVSMELAKQRAISLLDAQPDEHERNSPLQALVAELFREIAEGKIAGYEARMVEAVRGSVRRAREDGSSGGLVEMDGVMQTAGKIAPLLAEFMWSIRGEKAKDFRGQYLREGIWTAFDSFYIAKTEGEIAYDFREVLGLNKELFPNLFESRPELITKIRTTRPGILEAIEASRRFDENLVGRGPERR